LYFQIDEDYGMSTGQKEEHVVLVDVHDRRLGIEEKLSAHSNGGKLHRAVSVFVFNSQSEIMLQQRADTKYHSPSRWSNTCCSHPLDGEMILDAAHRRLIEEMGFDCELIEVFTFTYKCHLGQGITEHELDHVLFGRYDGEPNLNSEEVRNWRWIGLNDLLADVRTNFARYSEWLVILLRGRLVLEAERFLEHPSERLD
jgi:isopentenyl-diphosphate delta-isomerase